jgi:predicted RNA-binding Zn ribbon-like protein
MSHTPPTRPSPQLQVQPQPEAQNPRPRPLPDQEAAEPYVFELDAGWACLDFANTRGSSPSSADHLTSYADLVAFAAQSKLMPAEHADWLREQALLEPAIAAGVLKRARRLREAITAIFSTLAAGKRVPESELSLLNFDLAASFSHARIVPSTDGDGYRWGWSGRNLDAPLWPITRSAADLLTSDAERTLVRECGAEDCVWLFLDSTRNRSRQWCSMSSCGNREKARRHYQRVRERRSTPSDASAPRERRPARQTAATASGDASATAE